MKQKLLTASSLDEFRRETNVNVEVEEGAGELFQCNAISRDAMLHEAIISTAAYMAGLAPGRVEVMISQNTPTHVLQKRVP